jgi:hypothetical protein
MFSLGILRFAMRLYNSWMKQIGNEGQFLALARELVKKVHALEGDASMLDKIKADLGITDLQMAVLAIKAIQEKMDLVVLIDRGTITGMMRSSLH